MTRRAGSWRASTVRAWRGSRQSADASAIAAATRSCGRWSMGSTLGGGTGIPGDKGKCGAGTQSPRVREITRMCASPRTEVPRPHAPTNRLPNVVARAARCLGEHREARRGPARVGDGHLGLGFVCVALAAAANLLGGAVVTLRRWDDRLLRYAVALGAGFMLAAVLLKMLPESARLTRLAPGLVLGGYLLIHLFEHTVAPHFHFGEEVHPEQLGGSAGVSALLGLMVHSFFDGLSIGSGFVIGRALGL